MKHGVLKNGVRLVAVLVVMAGGLGIAASTASATTFPCGGFQHHTAMVSFRNGTVNLFRTTVGAKTTWCTYTARTGSYKGVPGATASDELVNGKDTSNIDLGTYKFYAGPQTWTSRCGQAYGAVGNAKGLLYAGQTKKYCVAS